MTMKKLKFIMHSKTLATWLLTTREKLKLFQGKVANDLGTTQAYLSGLERGAAKIISVDKWNKLYAYYLAKGAAPLRDDLDPIKTMPDVGAMRKQIQEMKEATKASLRSIGESLGVSVGPICAFMKGESIKTPLVYTMHEGLQKLKATPAALLQEDAIEVTKVKKPRATKKSLIETVPSTAGMPSMLELDMRELEIIQRMRSYHTQQNVKPKFLNGHRS